MSAYFNFIYTRHERDSIKMHDTPSRNALFFPAKAEGESAFESKMVNAGFDYRLASGLSFGFGLQTPITGRRIYRTTTLMGSIRFIY
jgi:hypothetical protein